MIEHRMPRGRPTTLKERNNVECPECGSTLTRGRGGGRSLDDHRIRRRRCDDCGILFCTVEIPLLYADGSPAPFDALVPQYRAANKARERERRGYHATTAGRKPYTTPARVVADVKVRRPVRRRTAGPWPS